jgi:hypothetical protein
MSDDIKRMIDKARDTVQAVEDHKIISGPRPTRDKPLTPEQWKALDRIEKRQTRRWREVYKQLIAEEAEIVGIDVETADGEIEFFSLQFTPAGDDVYIEIDKHEGDDPDYDYDEEGEAK